VYGGSAVLYWHEGPVEALFAENSLAGKRGSAGPIPEKQS
jgi:hypothetical protein